jgi:hypothetical protein
MMPSPTTEFETQEVVGTIADQFHSQQLLPPLPYDDDQSNLHSSEYAGNALTITTTSRSKEGNNQENDNNTETDLVVIQQHFANIAYTSNDEISDMPQAAFKIQSAMAAEATEQEEII